MKHFAYAAFIIILATLPAYCQIDTLATVQTGSIALPDFITRLYAQNVYGDSLNEIILCTSNYLYVYDSSGERLLWTSPALINPRDLQFADLDGDSIPDMAVHTDTAVLVFGLPDTTPWYCAQISPSLFRGFTTGDADDDGARDLLLMSQEPFDPSDRQDTAWFSLRYGPDFTRSWDNTLMLTNYDQFPDMETHVLFRETLNKIVMAKVGAGVYAQPLIFANTIIEDLYQNFSINDGYTAIQHTGRYYMFDTQEFQFLAAFSCGAADTLDVYHSGDHSIAFSSSNFTYIYHDLTSDGYIIRKRMLRFNNWGLDDSTVIFYAISNQERSCNWFACFGEMNPAVFGPEYCYGYGNAIYQNSLMFNTQAWSIPSPVDSVKVSSVFRSSDLFNSPEIIVKCIQPPQGYLFINGRAHTIDAILPDAPLNISLVADLESDGNDEILSVDGNTLTIFTLTSETGIREDIANPNLFALVGNYPNPFNARTIIKYKLPKQSNISLKIYDILGREIESLDKPNQPAGLGQITWDASGEPSGVFFYRLSAGSEQKTGRMVLLK